MAIFSSREEVAEKTEDAELVSTYDQPLERNDTRGVIIAPQHVEWLITRLCKRNRARRRYEKDGTKKIVIIRADGGGGYRLVRFPLFVQLPPN